jgi:hypothetical protein
MKRKNTTAPPKPIIAPFWRLAQAFAPLHGWHKPHLDTLHDVWKKGAPDPTSRIRNPIGYDPRHPQLGNYEARIVFPNVLAKWIYDVATTRGINDAQYKQILEKLTHN